ncbi:hypothetical protein [Nitrosospira briensis]|uniref:hypothetical protein n=1 Tax=Nitrosospira briensis TaxID=35799 RepID=UPI0008E4DBDD|nr:hypothetical protein [Nitrosospira briensis]SFO11725.1 hypothetical protein SAMN05216332_105128 [Nitrosospira briensis]
MHSAIENKDKANGQREQISELSLPDALALALQIHRRDHLVEAEILYRKILNVAQGYADACHFLGVFMYQVGDGTSTKSCHVV